MGLCTLNELPTQQGKLDLSGITALVGQMPNNYLIACRIQKMLGQFLSALSPEWPSNFVHPLLLQQAKQLLRDEVS